MDTAAGRGEALSRVLDAAEDASPVEAVEAVTRELGAALGTLALVNAGHVAPYLARAGTVAPVELPVDLPLGLFPDTAYGSTDLVLAPGDRLVIVTDGMLERTAAHDLSLEINKTGSLHPREATRRLVDNVLSVTGPSLEDDATLLVLDWHGHHGRHGRDRATVAGADPRASSAASDG